MVSPKSYLLGKIVQYKTNGLSSLGELHARHFEDIVSVMKSFATETVFDVVERLNNGEVISFEDGRVLSLNKSNKRKKQKV